MGFYFESFLADFVVLLVVAITSIYFYFQYKFKFWSSKGVHTLLPRIPCGNATDALLARRTLGEVIEDAYKHFKQTGEKFCGFYLFGTPHFVPIDPDLIKAIMVGDFNHFHDRVGYVNEEADPLSAHMFSIKGYKWRHLRTKLTPTFTSGKMKMMFNILLSTGQQLKSTIRESANKTEPINIKDLLARFTTDVIGSVAFGLDCNSLKNPESEFRKYGKMVFKADFMDNIRGLSSIVLPNLLKFFNIPLTNSKVTKFFLGAVRETLDYREKNNIQRNDFMNLLIKLKNNESIDDDEDTKNSNKDTNIVTDGLSFNEIAAQAFLFFAAGFETSSSTMAFTFYELCSNIDMQNKLREEVCESLKKHNEEFTYESIMEMKYMDKIVKETLRKYPIVPFLSRECVEDYKVPDSEVVIEKGTSIMISTLGLHSDPDIYPNPMKFDPERFNEENKSSRHPYTYLPFGEGPRNCIGMRFGLMQAKLGLAILLASYKFTINRKTTVPLVMDPKSFVLSSKGGIWLNCETV